VVVKRLERFGKHVGLAVLKRLIAECPIDPARIDQSRLRRIVVVRQDRRLGNLVLLTSLLAGLKRALPRAEIAVVAPVRFASILHPHPAVDRIVSLDHRRFVRAPWRWPAFAHALEAMRPDLAIDASPVHSASFLGGLVTWTSRAPYRLGYARPGAGVFLNVLVPPPARIPDEHESALLHELLRPLFPELPDAPPPEISVPAGAEELAARAYRRWGIGESTPIVGMHPGGRRGKRWPIAAFEAVATALAARGIAVLVFSGDAERPLLTAMSPPGPNRIYAPPTDVIGLRALVAGLDAFVSGDCGPMHVAAATGVPCIAIFRVADHRRYAPRGPMHRVLHHPEGEVEPGEVVAAVDEAVAGANAQLRRKRVIPQRWG
jgi:heptosyltransferase-2/heptosyltransferase-3